MLNSEAGVQKTSATWCVTMHAAGKSWGRGADG